MIVYHTSSTVIKEPDIYHGRKNADFGQGFYLSPDLDFSKRWASADSYINEYEFDTEGLDVVRFQRTAEWFEYIFSNRRAVDTIEADVVIGPIANDTIFDTFGIISSGFLSAGEATKLLMIGPEYTQIAIKSEKAVSQLKWLRADEANVDDAIRQARKADEEEYQRLFAEGMKEIEEQ